MTRGQLKTVLPTLDDLPAGFSPSKDQSKSEESSKDFLCGADFNGEQGRIAKEGTDYGAQEGLTAQQVTFGISEYNPAEIVRKQGRQFTNVVQKCEKFTSEGDTYTLTPMSAGRMGNRTVAAKMTTKDQGFDVTVNVIVVGAGPSLVTSLSASAGLTGSTVDDLVRLTRETVDRYESAANIS